MANNINNNKNRTKSWTKKYNIGASDPLGCSSIKAPKLPKGFRARCDLCNILFKTLDDLQKHSKEQHNYLKQRMPL